MRGRKLRDISCELLIRSHWCRKRSNGDQICERDAIKKGVNCGDQICERDAIKKGINCTFFVDDVLSDLRNVNVESGDSVTLKLDDKPDKKLLFEVKAVRNPMMRYLVIICKPERR